MPKSFEEIKNELVKKARVAGKKTNNPVIVAIVGAIGSGKSTITREIRKRTGWPIIGKDKIRVELREKGRGFNPQNTDQIHYAMLGKTLRGGGNIILDSDFVTKPKRQKLERFARRFRARVVYIRTICGQDVSVQRILRARYNPKTDLFKNTVIALREHIRRLSWHYRWTEKDGGQFILKKLPIKFLAEIDTTKPVVWKKKIHLLAKKLIRS